MEFEPIDEDLEDLLQEIVDKTDDCSGYASDIEYMNSEYRALKELGFFEQTREYLDGRALVKLKHSSLKYFDRKEKWKKEQRIGTAKGIGKAVVDKGVDLAASVVSKMAGM